MAWTSRTKIKRFIAVPVIIAITLHEAAHGFVARHFGDDTAQKAGRVTLNPLKHIDLFGTILLPAFLLLTNTGFLFGWAKPVPVNFSALSHPKRDMIWVAAVGPGMNILLAAISGWACRWSHWPGRRRNGCLLCCGVRSRSTWCWRYSSLADPSARRQQDRGGAVAACVGAAAVAAVRSA